MSRSGGGRPHAMHESNLRLSAPSLCIISCRGGDPRHARSNLRLSAPSPCLLLCWGATTRHAQKQLASLNTSPIYLKGGRQHAMHESNLRVSAPAPFCGSYQHAKARMQLRDCPCPDAAISLPMPGCSYLPAHARMQLRDCPCPDAAFGLPMPYSKPRVAAIRLCVCFALFGFPSHITSH